MVGRQNAVPLKFDPNLLAAAFSAVFFNFNESRLEAADDVISGRLMAPDVTDNHAKFDDPRLNLSREITPEAV